MSKFKKGNPGKPKGATNLITRTVKDAVLAAFNNLQDHPSANLESWGANNPTAFYQVAAKLIPTELTAKVEDVTKQTFKIGDQIIEF